MEFHEAANIFPMDEESIPDLAEDIRKNGLEVPIERFDGKIIDGRRRLKACELAGVEPKFKDVSPSDPVAYVLSLNLQRRHLDISQRAMVGGRAKELRERYEKEAKERQRLSPGRGKKGPVVPPDLNGKGDTRELIGKAVGVGGNSIDKATRVLDKGVPELVQAVDSGELKVWPAARIAELPKEEQVPALSKVQSRAKPDSEPDSEPEPEPEIGHKSRGKGVALAHQAINLLDQIPKNDGLRKEGLHIVLRWVQRALKGM